MHLHWQTAIEIAQECGFSHAALVPAEPVAYTPHAESARQKIVANPRCMFPAARSVLVAAMPFAWHTAWPDDCGEVSAFYFHSQRSHEAIDKAAQALRALGACVCAEQRMPSKLFGVRAGFGVIGQNSLLRNDAWGSCFTLRTLLTDIEPQPAVTPMDAKPCGACTRCVQACPASALRPGGVLAPERCLRTYMLGGGLTPDSMRQAMGTRLLGCEICQRACPCNAHIPLVTPQDTGSFQIGRLLCGDREAVRAVAAQLGRNEARPQRLQAQAALAAGNSGNRKYISLLTGLAAHPRPSIAEHARWSITMLEREDER